MNALLLALVVASSPVPPAAAIRVGLDPRGAPWAFVPGRDYMKENFSTEPLLSPDELSRLAGLDVDVAQALARRMGRRLQIVPVRWEDIESDLLKKRYDLILNAWTPSEKTRAGIVASDPYYEWGLTVAARREDQRLHALEDLAGCRLGHINDPAVLRALRAMGSGLGAQLIAVTRGGDELFERLAGSDFDAIVYDSAYVRWRVARDPRFRVVGEPLNRLGYHVGVRAEDKALLAAVQAAVKGFVASDEAAAIRARWESAETPSPDGR